MYLACAPVNKTGAFFFLRAAAIGYIMILTMSRWFVYIVRCRDGSLYTGITVDLVSRIKKHNIGTGAKYTRSRAPVELVWREQKSSEGAARRREALIKQLTRAEKLCLINAYEK